MLSAFISRVILLVFGTLYPAYRSYKAIKNKDVREYVKWMMYWIIFAFFTTAETFADVFVSWLPLYYEIKIVFIIWLLSPATKGSSILYRKFVHPRLVRHEKAIDRYIDKAQRNSYATLMDVGKKGLNVASDTLMKTAVSGQIQLVQTLKRYNSMQDLQYASDSTDAAQQPLDRKQRTATWYGQQFDPDDDLAVLQQQYRQSDLIEEETYDDRTAFSRSASDINVSSNHEDDSVPMENTEVDDSSARKSDQINYAYSSSTLPRSRKPRKPLYQNMPVTTRSKRSSKNMGNE